MMHFPPPGLDGTYRDSCIVCLKGTDTAVAFSGEAEFVLAGFVVLGVPFEQAQQILELETGCAPGLVPDGEITTPVRVCQSCVDKSAATFPTGTFPGPVPVIGPKAV